MPELSSAPHIHGASQEIHKMDLRPPTVQTGGRVSSFSNLQAVLWGTYTLSYTRKPSEPPQIASERSIYFV